MGVIKQGILGGFQNKVGPVIGSSWKGIATMRAMPISVANPRTALQVGNRNKFSRAAKMGSKLLATIIKPLWDRFAQEQSGFNAWVQANLPDFLTSGTTNLLLLEMSRGTVALPSGLTCSYQALTEEFTVTWDPTPIGDALPTDMLYFAAAFDSGNKAQGYPAVAPRSAGTISFARGAFSVGAGAVGYMMFRRADGSKVSNSRSQQM